jgi:hypothetical protein
MSTKKLRVGDWVEVLTKEEILATLDKDARLHGMPFMPEMFDFCGKKFRVYKSAHKTCDPDLKSRRINNTVHLETRCDGRAHGGCQAGCLIYWKEAWLKPACTDASAPPFREPASKLVNIATGKCNEGVVADSVQVCDARGGGFSYFCQITQVQYETPLAWWDLRQYIEDYTSGNISLGRLISGTIYSMYFNLSQAGIGLGPVMRWFFEIARPLWGGVAWPRKVGPIAEGQPTPTAELHLQPGEIVRVKPYEDILKTVNTSNRNRGLWWDAELVPYCGKTYKVIGRVTRLIDEKTGKLQVMKNPCIILDSVVCGARYSSCRMFCPKSTYAYWREIWLERVELSAPIS